ncbi:Crp/Fnr family transcriptional regulator [Paracoccus marinaquae]|uniref:Crp/Fnr family transcriptional regulator n=1 Tax=Paracoccus marinaquae TaxID=2841926 RepID=A0ABS6AL15_9RHOB|nr:Crp/Fnr family transcriptional regulator [Paracoccus marinaquae]MBU3030592.1 Crp/Fnr family transcriptional regulator [Paracoccus marinaquae]
MTVDISLLRGLALFRQLDETTLSRLMKRATLRRFAAGDTVFEQGAPARTFFMLISGRLKVTQVTADGRQVMVRVVHPGDLFGFARALSRSDYPGTSRAAVDSQVIGWPMADWDAVVESTPQLALNAMQTIGQRLDEAHTRLRELSTEEVERRVAHTVLRLTQKAGRRDGDGTRIDFPISRQDIAEMTGTTLHTVSRILSGWESRGIVRGGRQRLTLVDSDALRQIADPEI